MIFFFFNDTATTEIYTLSLHDALPIYIFARSFTVFVRANANSPPTLSVLTRSEEHTSELQSPCNLVCRLLLEKKNMKSPSSLTRSLLLLFTPPTILFFYTTRPVDPLGR